MPELGLNIDHVATLREARYRDWKKGLAPEPNVLSVARLAEQAGVDAITVHLREDRRHIQDEDVRLLRAELKVPMNLELAATPEMVGIATLQFSDGYYTVATGQFAIGKLDPVCEGAVQLGLSCS